MKIKSLLSLVATLSATIAYAAPIESFETPYTISLVRTAEIKGKPRILASSYDGNLLCYDFAGKLLWDRPLTGYFNQDICAADLDGDGSDEMLAANSDGTLFCLGADGKIKWQRKLSETPLSALAVIEKEGKSYIACGAYDTNLYYLDAKGELLSTVGARSYSISKASGLGGSNEIVHVPNLIRTMTLKNGKQILAMEGSANSMAVGGTNVIYLFEPLAQKPYKTIKFKGMTKSGAIAINDLTPSGEPKLIIGSTKGTNEGMVAEIDIETEDVVVFSAYPLARAVCGGFGYRVAQCEVMNIGGKPQHLMLFGSAIIMPTYENTPKSTKAYQTRYSYNDCCKDATSTKLIMASAQSGGNCIHIIDMNDKGWSSAYEKLQPKGNITSILESSERFRGDISKFTPPAWEPKLETRPVVCFMSEGPNRDEQTKLITDKIHAKYPSPIFLNSGNTGGSQDPKDWNRDTMSNDHFRDRRDRRQKYANTQDNILKNVAKAYTGDSKGMSMWGGHGNDPFYYSPETQCKMMDLTDKDQQTVLIFPEMEGRGEDIVWLMENYLYPLADHAREHNTKLFIRSKHLFWLGNVYEKQWNKLISGEYADVFVPSMEETTDKSMELSVMGRLGVWMSGSVDSWGSRCARDNASYNRLRQHSHQNLPNNFLRNMIYHISLGAQYLDNFKVDQQYMSLLWDMIAKGLLYVPQRDEIVSLNPVRLTILEPDQAWLDEGNNVKWTCLYDAEREAETPWVMGRLNGTWPAAPTTEWDFSRYAAGAEERRLNFISSYNNGHVMFTPPYDSEAPRGAVEQYLNPIYKGKTKEFFTDGRYYYSDAKMSQRYSPKEYYKEVEKAIVEGAAMLPLTVKGEVGWVAAQSAPTHLRLTVIDGGYVDPSEKQATIKIGSAKVKSITDLVSGEKISIKGGEANITIPCGMFRFFDVELAEAL